MKLNRNHIIYLIFLPVTFVLAVLGLKYGESGVMHYGSFVLGAIVVYDGIKTYQLTKKLSVDIALEVMIGTFMFSEHLFLYQEFLAGTINF